MDSLVLHRRGVLFSDAKTEFMASDPAPIKGISYICLTNSKDTAHELYNPNQCLRHTQHGNH